MSCVRKHKYDDDKILLSDKKIIPVLVDILLMESYVNEKMQGSNADTITILKKSFYKTILNRHKVDSASFYSTFYYYQSHPKEFTLLLSLVDSSLSKIHPKDTSNIVSPIVTAPDNIDVLTNFKEQEKAMRDEFIKNNDTLKPQRRTLGNRIKKNN